MVVRGYREIEGDRGRLNKERAEETKNQNKLEKRATNELKTRHRRKQMASNQRKKHFAANYEMIMAFIRHY